MKRVCNPDEGTPGTGSSIRIACGGHAPAARHSRKGVWGMDVSQATNLVRHTLVLAMMIAAPMLLIGLVVGLVVSLFQAVTQIQEQSLAFIPKTAAMIAAAIFLMPWISQHLIEYTRTLFESTTLLP